MVKGTKVSSKKSIKKSAKKGTSKSIKNDNKTIFLAVILVCLLIILAVSLTYAYFTRNITVNGEDPKTIVETGLLDVNFETSAYIKNTNATLINDSDAYLEADRTDFSVARSNDNTVKYVYYTLQLVDINISDNLKSPYLKWRLYDTTKITDITADTPALKEGNFETLNCQEGVEVCTTDLYDSPIALPDVTHKFALLIWLSNDESTNQTELLQGTISAKVQVTAVNVNEDSSETETN